MVVSNAGVLHPAICVVGQGQAVVLATVFN